METNLVMPIFFGRGEIFGELPGIHGGGADIARLAAFTTSCSASMVSSIGVCMVEAVDLVEIDIVHAQPLQRIVDGMQDVLARQAAMAASPSGRTPWWPAHNPRGLPAKSFSARPTTSSRGAIGIDVGGVEEIDPRLQRALDEGRGWPPPPAPSRAIWASHRSWCPGRCARPSGRYGPAGLVPWHWLSKNPAEF